MVCWVENKILFSFYKVLYMWAKAYITLRKIYPYTRYRSIDSITRCVNSFFFTKHHNIIVRNTFHRYTLFLFRACRESFAYFLTWKYGNLFQQHFMFDTRAFQNLRICKFKMFIIICIASYLSHIAGNLGVEIGINMTYVKAMIYIWFAVMFL